MGLWLRRLTELDSALCRHLSRGEGGTWARWPFTLASRLGDGGLWYALMALLPLVDGRAGLAVSLRMLATGAVALALYKAIKALTRRERPCNRVPGVRAHLPPLDHFSFPSGHTLHAVSFSTLAVYHYPVLAWPLVPFTLLVAGSRVVLGLHYPSDVLVAMVMGLALAYGAILALV